jgi:hypothetical protein
MQKTDFFTKTVFCSISFHGWLFNHAVCKIRLKRNLRRFYVEMLNEVIINKNVKSRMSDLVSRISLSLLDMWYDKKKGRSFKD